MNAAIDIRDLSFSYPGGRSVLSHADLCIEEGSFAVLCGPTGSGKTTLLRLLKPEIAPVGEISGERLLFGVPAEEMNLRDSSVNIAFVFQNPENQIVCDTVWHELAFGLENLGMPVDEMRMRIAETCTWLGIGQWFRMRCEELSGGQQQVLALAAALTMHPRLILLDEPTSMLDPVAEKEFLSLLFRANRELGTTVLVATHKPSAYRSYATCAFTLEQGTVLPLAIDALGEQARVRSVDAAPLGSTAIEIEDAWLRYRRDSPWVLRGFDLSLHEGEIRALAGGNASGKSTVLSFAAGMLSQQRGKIKNGLAGSQAYLPQNPKALLARETVAEELLEWAPSCGYGEREVAQALARIGLAEARDAHPYDISGGQQQLLALEKLLLTSPKLLLLDEPTKGLDAQAAEMVAARLLEARDRGAAILVATHDFTFVRRVATSVTLIFDGQAAATLASDEFFSRSWLLGS